MKLIRWWIKKVGRLWECKVCWLFGCKVVNDSIINRIVDSIIDSIIFSNALFQMIVIKLELIASSIESKSHNLFEG